MNKPRKQLYVGLGKLDDPFRESCAARGITPNAEIRRLVANSLQEKAAPLKQKFKSNAAIDETRLRREIRFSESEFEAGTRLAAYLGTNMQGMVIALIRNAVESEAIFSEKEVLALSASSLQLGALGRNFNQLVKRLNADIDPLPTDYANAVALIGEIQTEIRAQIKCNVRLITAAEGRWQLIAAGVLHD